MQANVDLYNASNASSILAITPPTDACWLRPTQILQGRLLKFGGADRFLADLEQATARCTASSRPRRLAMKSFGRMIGRSITMTICAPRSPALLIGAARRAGPSAEPPKTVRMYVFDCGVLKIADPMPLFGLKKEEVGATDLSDAAYLDRAPARHADVGGRARARRAASARAQCAAGRADQDA